MSELDADIAQLNQHPNLAALIALLVTIIEQQTQRIAQLESELAQLRAQVNQNSQNSHKPPSSEGYRKAPAIPMNEATIQAANRCTASALVPSQAAIEAHLAQAAVAHADETGLRCAGRLHWLHVLSTPRLSTYFVHPKRGHLALESSSLLARFSGCLVHDCWGSYFVVHPGAHGLCNTHLIRELRALSEQGAAWAGALIEVFLERPSLQSRAGCGASGGLPGPEAALLRLTASGFACPSDAGAAIRSGSKEAGQGAEPDPTLDPVSRGGVAFCPRRGGPVYQQPGRTDPGPRQSKCQLKNGSQRRRRLLPA